MNPGTQVVFTGASDDQVRWGGNDDPRKYLNVGQAYTVAVVEPHSWHTKIELAELPGKRFNNVSFEERA